MKIQGEKSCDLNAKDRNDFSHLSSYLLVRKGTSFSK